MSVADLRRGPVAVGIVAGLLAALVMAGAPPGTDYAAHVYQSGVYHQNGLIPWDNRWYAGRYAFVTYSVLYYPLASVLGIALLAVLSVAATAGLVASAFAHEWGPRARPASWAFAVAWPAFLLTGAFPFALGMTFAVLACWALQRERRAVACLASALALAASPLSFALLCVTLVGAAAAKRPGRPTLTTLGLTLAGLGVIEQLLWRAFPSGGRNPFPVGDMLGAVAFCAVIVLLSRRSRRARTLAWVFACNGVATLVCFALPSVIGQGISRFQFFALPVAVLAICLSDGGRARRVLGALAIALAAYINLPPLVSSFVDGERSAAASEAYWRPAVRFLEAHTTPVHRVEAVDTIGHWPAVYLARAGIPIARGWFRQDDYPLNTVLYDRPSAAAYADWLQLMGVRYVVLTDAQTDYSAQQEARLIRSGRAGLQLVKRFRHASIYAVRSPGPLVVGLHAARVTSITQTGVTVQVGGPGTYRLAVRYTPYWRASAGCTDRAGDGMTLLTVRRAQTVRLRFAWDATRAARTILGIGAGSCRA